RRGVICGVDIKSPERIERVFLQSISLPDFLRAAAVDIDRPLGEESEHTTDIGHHEIDLRKSFQYPAVDQAGHGYRTVKSPAEDQGGHDSDSWGLGRSRRR